MDVWADRLAGSLRRNDVTLLMLAKYIDDINLVLQAIPKGYEWVREAEKVGKKEGGLKLMWTQSRMDRDCKEGRTDSTRTFDLIKEIGNRLVPGLSLTVDLPELHASGKCPMLDPSVWIENKEGYNKI